MDINQALPLLGGQSPVAFMRRHWQKRPLCVRQAVPDVTPPVGRAALFELAAQDDVESRLISQQGGQWRLRHGPLPRRALPPAARAGWTLLVQGLDLHVEAAHRLLQAFRFVPDARVDDLMLSYASDQGGVGPHVDAYDVFLLQVAGRRRWKIAPPGDHPLRDDVPLKMLQPFAATDEWLLEPGDMLYLPPHWPHEGVAEGGDCMTCSIGFRAPGRAELARDLLLHLAEAVDTDGDTLRYQDRAQAATAEPAQLPTALVGFARDALQRALKDPRALSRALGEVLSEPKPKVWFAISGDSDDGLADGLGVRLDRRTRMLYDADYIFVNGESFRAAGRDARLLHGLADARRLSAAQVRKLSDGARGVLDDWLADGWIHLDDEAA